MSRIGSQAIAIPGGVEVKQDGRTVSVKGPKGNLSLEVRPEVDVAVESGQILVTKNGSGASRQARAFHGTMRALINNMVVGVSTGYSVEMEIVGVGWNASAQGKKLTLNIGFCHPVEMEVGPDMGVETPKPTIIIVTGPDKQAVGQFAAKVRAVRPPEPYKGKGIRYKDEHVRRKQGKSFGS